MKRLLNQLTHVLVWIALLLPGAVSAQTLLVTPESVAYDHLRNRHLLSSFDEGHIVMIDSLRQQSYFNTDLKHSVGLHIVGDTLLAAYFDTADAGLAGINLATGALDFLLPLPDAVLPNGIASDTSGNVYVTDSEGDRMYRIRISDLDYGVFVDTGWAAFEGPNGIVFDKYNNRMLVLGTEARNSPIVAVGVVDTSKTVLVRTQFATPGTDGLTSDNNGYTYLSSWFTHKIHRYGPDFQNPPFELEGWYNGPADIQFNEYLDQIDVPCFLGDTLRSVPINTTSVDESGRSEIPPFSAIGDIRPNPFNPKTEITYSLTEPGHASLVIYDVRGRKVRVLADGDQSAGFFAREWLGFDDSGREVSSGVYFAQLETKGVSESRKLVLIR